MKDPSRPENSDWPPRISLTRSSRSSLLDAVLWRDLHEPFLLCHLLLLLLLPTGGAWQTRDCTQGELEKDEMKGDHIV